MRKIFGYECKRLMWNKFSAGLALVLLFYGWQVLSRVTILGVSHTAPFSPWSFGDYLSRMLPLLWIGALFFLTFFLSGPGRRTAVLTCAAPMSPRRYALARCAAALAGTGLFSLVCLGEAALFYQHYFHWSGWPDLLPPVLIILLPPLIFALGSGWCLGQIHPRLIYGWMLLPFAVQALPLPQMLGLWSGRFFTDYPLTLGVLDPEFTLPVQALLLQCLLLLAGAALLTVGAGGLRSLGKKRFRPMA